MDKSSVVQVRWSQFQALAEKGVISQAVAEAIWDHLSSAAASKPAGLPGMLLSLVSAVNVIYAVGSAAISAVFLYWVVQLLRTHNQTELQRRRSGLMVVGLSVAYGFAFYKTGASLLQNPGSHITGGLLHTAAVLVVPLAVYGVIRGLGGRMHVTLQATRSLRDGIARIPTRFHVFCGLMEAVLLVASLLLYQHEGVPMLLAPAAISSYLLVVSATLCLHARFPPALQPPLVYTSLAYALGMVWLCRMAGPERPVLRMAALISAMNTLAWSLPLALVKVAVADDIMDWTVMRTFLRQAWEGRLDTTTDLTVATYALLQTMLLAYAVRERTWVCIPYALVGLVAVSNISRRSWRWSVLLCLPIGILMVAATFAARASSDLALLNVLSLLGQPQTLLTYVLWAVRVLMAATASSSLWRGAQSLSVAEFPGAGLSGWLGLLLWTPLMWAVMALLTGAATDEPFLGVGGVWNLQALGWLITLACNVLAVAADGAPQGSAGASSARQHRYGFFHWSSSAGSTRDSRSVSWRLLIGSTAVVLLGYRFCCLAASSTATVALMAVLMVVVLGCMVFMPPNRSLWVWTTAALLLSLGLTSQGLEANWKLITLCGLLGIYLCLIRWSEWVYYRVPRDKRTACVCVLLTAAGIATVKVGTYIQAAFDAQDASRKSRVGLAPGSKASGLDWTSGSMWEHQFAAVLLRTACCWLFASCERQ